MLLLTERRIGRLADLRLGRTAGKALLAAGAMAGLMALVLAGLNRLAASWPVDGVMARLLLVGLPAGVGLAAYWVLVTLLRVEEVSHLRATLRLRLGHRRLD